MRTATQTAQSEYRARASLALILGFLCGIVFESFFGGEFLSKSLSEFWVFGFAAFSFFYWRFGLRRWYVLALALFLLGAGSGMLRLSVAEGGVEARALALAPYVGKKVEVEGVVVAEPDERAAHTNLTVRIDFILSAEAAVQITPPPVEGTILLRTERFPEFSYGDRVRAEGRLDEPEAFLTDLGRTFDYRGYLRARGVTHTLSFAQTELVAEGEGAPLIAVLLSLKRMFMDNIERALPEPSAGLAEGVTLGVKRALGEDLETAFRRTGIIHIVVLSGYNVSIVAEAIMRLLSHFFRPRVRVVAGVLAIAAFAIVVGLSATVVRASLMASLILYARATGKTGNALRTLLFAGVVMLLINPHLLLHDPGFQLSFLATLGLITLSPLVESKLSLLPTKLQLREFATATLSTQIFILPFLLFLIGELSIVSVLVNVLVLPAVPLSMLGTFFVGALGSLGSVGGVVALVIAFPTYILLQYIIIVAEWFGELPLAAVSVPAFSFLAVIAAYAAITAFLYRIDRAELTTSSHHSPNNITQ